LIWTRRIAYSLAVMAVSLKCSASRIRSHGLCEPAFHLVIALKDLAIGIGFSTVAVT